jgi:hypothetical protein
MTMSTNRLPSTFFFLQSWPVASWRCGLPLPVHAEDAADLYYCTGDPQVLRASPTDTVYSRIGCSTAVSSSGLSHATHLLRRFRLALPLFARCWNFWDC